MKAAVLGAIASGRPKQYGGYAIGDLGAAGSIYEGYYLAYAADFASLDLISKSNPKGKRTTTRGCYSGNGGRRYPLSGPLAVMHDVSPDYTGPNDSNRGVPLNFDSHTVVAAEDGTMSAIRLLTKRQTAEEQIQLATGNPAQIERAAMIGLVGEVVWNGPCIVDYQMRQPTGPAGQHPSVWNLQAQPQNSTSVTGHEYGFEGNGSIQNAYLNQWSGGVNTPGPVQQVGTPDPRSGQWVTLTNKLEADFKWYANGSLKQSGGVPNNLGNKADSGIISNHVYNSTYGGQNYVAAAWAAATAGVAMDCAWFRVWAPIGSPTYRPLVDLPDVLLATESAPLSYVFPSQQDLWGATGLNEYVCCLPVEVDEPGGSNSASYDQFPAGLSYTAGTRTAGGTMPPKAGLLQLIMFVTENGVVCRTARALVYVAPIWRGGSSFSFPIGAPVDLDIYSLWDVGVLFLDGDNRKGLAASALPSGLTLNTTTGRITGTPTATSILGSNFSATNYRGQTTSVPITIVAFDPDAGVPAPVLTGNPAILGSWDYGNLSTIAQSGGAFDAIYGADGTTFALTQPVSGKRPTVDTRGGRSVARFTSAQQQFLQIASALGASSANGVTIVSIYEPATVAASQAVADLGNGASTGAFNRLNMTGGVASGWGTRKASAGGQSDANVAGTFTLKKRLLISVFKPTTGGSSTSIDGTGTPVNSGTGQAWPTGMTHYTSGARRVSNTEDLFLDGYKWREIAYDGELNATQLEELGVYGATFYGTDNNA
ncbi:Ig domain-containing protein [Methylibium sp.]|uniref:Ig domain-containing protein n=1 Tax=Methylibium sp. TaxID=2067992 RepID=UPI003BA8DAC9